MPQAVALIDCCLPEFYASVDMLGVSVPKSDLCMSSAVGLFVNTTVEFMKVHVECFFMGRSGCTCYSMSGL